MMKLYSFILLLIGIANAQFPNGRHLEGPVPALCAQRTLHSTFNNKAYFFSWRDPRTSELQEDWLGVRNFCRKRCMDAVSLDSPAVNGYIKKQLVDDKVKYIWTSGRVCDFRGCERPDLQPTRINGWFWTATLKKFAPATSRAENDWSESGGIKAPQPDNREELQNGASENCVALLNNFYGDGIHWHDVACHHRKPFVCEDSEALLKHVRLTNPNILVP